MCIDCGCPTLDHDHHHHSHDETHDHDHGHRTIRIEEDLLAKNNRLAAHNREVFATREVFVLNLVSSPGSGKTSILERTLADLKNRVRFAVIEGDQQTANDANRIAATGVPVRQINTGAGCHLDAAMVARALAELAPEPDSIVFIENVGNLVCPALFDLGEARKVVVISVTEGDDKPLKYPHMFAAADLVVLNKMDLLPHVDFDPERLARDARSINPQVRILPLSAKTGEGLDAWLTWLTSLQNPDLTP
jgi:hydrogenase nickel incorporation protein HypB